MKKKNHLILLLLILIGLGSCIGILSPRITAEESHKTYDIVLDYSSLEEMADESDESVEFWLRHFSTLGVDKLGLNEETLSSLSREHPGVIYVNPVNEIQLDYGWQQDYPQQVQDLILNTDDEDSILVTCTDPQMLEWIVDALSRRCEYMPEVIYDENGHGFLFLTGDGKDVTGAAMLRLPLGLDPDKQAMAQNYGYTLIPRTLPVENLNGIAFAEDVLRSYEQLGVPYLIGGSSIPGGDDKEGAIALWVEYLEKSGATVGVVEASDQSMNLTWDGLEELVAASGDNAVRIFSMWDYIQWRYGWYDYEGSEEIVNCLYRAAYERNCSVIYLKMMMRQLPDGTTEYITDPEEYTAMLGSFQERMAQRGYTWQTVRSVGEIEIGLVPLILVAAGAIAAAVWLVDLMIPLSKKLMYLLTGLGCICAAGLLVVMPSTARLILSIGGGIALPSLAAVMMMGLPRRKNLLPACLEAVAVTGLISLAGGLFACAPLSDSSYMLEMELYRGVKFMQMIPLVVFVCDFLISRLGQPCRAFLAQPKEQKKAAVNRIMETPVKVKFLVFGAVILLVGMIFLAVGSYYMARTGHSGGAGVADLELQLRNLLEYHLPARPRTKEFLIGYPCIMLFAWCRQKGLNWLSAIPGLGAVIGLTSIVNTFLHIRTPFSLSLIRVGTGLVFGIVVGFVALAVAELIYRFIQKRLSHA